MTPSPFAVLVINAGSSSLKFALVDAHDGRRHLAGAGERLDTPEAVIHLDQEGARTEHPRPGASAGSVVGFVLDHLGEARAGAIQAVGHRVVHGGAELTDAVLVDDEVLRRLHTFDHLAPLHNPANLAGIEAVRRALPHLPHVAVFDTAFHHRMPPASYRYAIPTEWYERYGVRRYGFHGTSHRFVSRRAAVLLGRAPDDLRLVTAHLGNGCSAAAVRDGISVDTTMGLTPMEGLVMGTRSGDIDPGLFALLAEHAGLGPEAVTDVLNHHSGLLALSGRSNDMRTILEARAGGDADAELAVDVFVHRLAKAVAGLVVGIERLDALVFTGGIGEHSPEIRRLVLDRLGFLGLHVDEARNAADGRSSNGRISDDGAPVALVIPTDEEAVIAEDTARVVGDVTSAGV